MLNIFVHNIFSCNLTPISHGSPPVQELFVEVGCFEKVVEALRLVKEQAKEVGLAPIACSLPLSTCVFSYILSTLDRVSRTPVH